ncbi:type IV secretion protein Rhs [Escherichia coli]|nr:type IV secretion protein Rhs [Escherichia coli]
MGCQKDIAEKIQKQGGDYLFAVKGNQGRLNKAFEEKFPLKELINPKHDSYAISEKSHGRKETRLHIAVPYTHLRAHETEAKLVCRPSP